MTTLIVSNVSVLRTERGKENLVSVKIARGSINTDHPCGEKTFYNLETVTGELYQVLMAEVYFKTQIVTGKKGTYMSFYFPLDGFVPAVGDTLIVK